MAISTYSELKDSIADHLDDDALTSQIDDFIDLAEARHKTDIRIREMLTRTTLTIDDRHEALPSSFLEALTLRILETEQIFIVKQCSLDVMNRKRVQSPQGRPRWFTVHLDVLGPVPRARRAYCDLGRYVSAGCRATEIPNDSR